MMHVLDKDFPCDEKPQKRGFHEETAPEVRDRDEGLRLVEEVDCKTPTAVKVAQLRGNSHRARLFEPGNLVRHVVLPTNRIYRSAGDRAHESSTGCITASRPGQSGCRSIELVALKRNSHLPVTE